ncbi:response regulator [Amycolatopsis suaedae]|uniref:Response regulator transcription factor n=1 Tax=Amycolatopsis suaedae TaxID=2510978 RepID=A0A4Q7J0J2_9PSEU|nr:response regulator transcription factor [Amycolatopsis suaedae]RZQ59454.1 response regulator transcription factor [Amycolatopsis suaedae]
MIRVLIVDDEVLVRAGFRMILQAADDIEIVAEASDGKEAVDAVLKHWPDVVLMDVRMSGMDGLRALQEISRLPKAPKVIMLTTFDLDDYVHTALRAGASGFLLKDTSPHDLMSAVRTVAAGSAMLSPTVTKRLIDEFAGREPGRTRQAREQLATLTGREMDVLNGVADGLSNAEIAKQLSMSEATVKAHVSRTLTKLGLANRVQAAMVARDAAGW